MSTNDAADLIGRWMEDELTAAESRQLLTMAQTDTAVRQQLLDQAVLHGMLGQLAVTEEEFGRAVRERFRSLADAPEFVRCVDTRLRKPVARTPQPAKIVHFPLWPLAAAATVAIGVVAWWMMGTKPTSDLPQMAGRSIKPGETVQVPDEGNIDLVYADGTKLIMRGGAAFKIPERTKEKRLELTAGTLVADVAKQPAGQPMQLTTPQGQFTVVGTKFFLMVAKGSSNLFTRLDVTEGLVRATANGQDFDVGAGQAICLGEGIESKLLPCDGREFSPRYGGIFFRGTGAAYDAGKLMLPSLSRPETSMFTTLSSPEFVELLRQGQRIDRASIVSFVNDVSRISFPSNRTIAYRIAAKWNSRGVMKCRVRFFKATRGNDFDFGFAGMEATEGYVPYGVPPGIREQLSHPNQTTLLPLEWSQIEGEVEVVGQMPDGRRVLEYRNTCNGDVIDAGWKVTNVLSGPFISGTKCTVEISGFQFWAE